MKSKANIEKEDKLKTEVSWEPLPCPWYVPSMKIYGFAILHSCLGHEINTIRQSSCNLMEGIVWCLVIILPLGLGVLFPEQFWVGGVCLGVLLFACVLMIAVQIRYKPHFDLPKRFFYRGINRFDCKRGQFDQLSFDEIHALQIVPIGKKEHCQLVAVLHDGSRKLLIHGGYRQLLGVTVYDNVKGKAEFSKKPSPCFLNAVAPIWDDAQFPLPYTPVPEPVAQESYQPPDGVILCEPEDLKQFNRGFKEQGYYGAISWADAKNKGTGFQPLPLYLLMDAFEVWPEKLYAAGVKTTVQTDDLYECCGRSLDTNHFDGLNLTVEFENNIYSLLLFLKLPFADSGKVEAFFYSENPELLKALKSAGLEDSALSDRSDQSDQSDC